MTDLDVDDPLTKLNTQLNKSMVLMDTSTENKIHQSKSNRSIKINTKIQPASASNISPISRKSILKKSEERNSDKQYRIEAQNAENNRTINHDKMPMSISTAPRPQNINDLVQEENLIEESTDPTFNFDSISDNEEMWIMDIPRTIDPQELKGQILVFGEKSKFKIKEERYCAVHHDVKCNITCVFNTGKTKTQYKTVNAKPAGTITIRRKLSGISKTKPMQIENSGVPFPKNLKIRHPLFGVSQEGKVRKCAIK